MQADPQPLLVVAGPGSGKTFSLIERIRFLIENHRLAQRLLHSSRAITSNVFSAG